MPQIGDVYRVVEKSRLFGTVEVRNMFTYALTSANCTDEEISEALSTQVDTIFGNIKALCSNQWATYGDEIQKWYPAAGGLPGYFLTYDTHNLLKTGELGTDITGYQPAILYVLKTAAKRVLGRKFFAGLAEAQTTNGAMAATAAAQLAATLVEILSTVNMGAGGAAAPGVLDKTGVFRPFVGGIAGNIISSMRRRKPGYGI